MAISPEPAPEIVTAHAPASVPASMAPVTLGMSGNR